MQSTPPFSCPPAGATRASARGVTAEWGGCNGLLDGAQVPYAPLSSGRGLLRLCLTMQGLADHGAAGHLAQGR